MILAVLVEGLQKGHCAYEQPARFQDPAGFSGNQPRMSNVFQNCDREDEFESLICKWKCVTISQEWGPGIRVVHADVFEASMFADLAMTAIAATQIQHQVAFARGLGEVAEKLTSQMVGSGNVFEVNSWSSICSQGGKTYIFRVASL